MAQEELNQLCLSVLNGPDEELDPFLQDRVAPSVILRKNKVA